MQKYLFILLFFVVSTISLFAQQSEITVKGTVQFPVEGINIRVSQVLNKSKKLIDSISVNPDKTFEKTIKLPAPGVYEIDCQKGELLNFWGENETVEVNFRGEETLAMRTLRIPYRHIEAPGENNQLMNLVSYSDYRTRQSRSRAIKDLSNARKNENKEWEARIMGGFVEAQADGDANVDYLAKSYHTLNSVVALLPRIKDEEIKKEVLDYLDKNKSDYAPYVAYKEIVADKEAKLAQSAKGMPSPNFAYIFEDGKQGENLKEYKGKYLLIDFWASWCGPCRKSIPALKKLYKKYGSKDFEIISVSIDSEKANWLKAVDEEDMPWPQIFTEDVGKDVMSKYQFGFIPFLVMIDKEGKIMHRGISMAELEKLLEEVL